MWRANSATGERAIARHYSRDTLSVERIGQFYSIGGDLTIADVGLMYVFVCFDDCEARAIVQSG